MKVVTTFYPPSSVTASAECRLDPNSEYGHLAIAKTNRIYIYSLATEGLRLECELEVWGRILALRPIQFRGSQSSNLLVLTDHPEPQLILLGLTNVNGTPSLVSKGAISLHDRHATHAEFCTDVALHPSGQLGVVSCYKGKLTVVHFKKGSISDHFDITVQELNLLSLAFVGTTSSEHTLALLHIDHQQRTQLVSRTLRIFAQELSPSLSPILPNSILPSRTFPSLDPPPFMVPIRPPFSDDDIGTENEDLGGVLVIGGRKIQFFEEANQDRQHIRKGKQVRLDKRKASTSASENLRAREKEKDREGRKVKPKASVKWPWSDVTTWCAIESDARKFLLCDRFGRLSLLAFDLALGLLILPIGEVSPATSLTYLGSGVVYVGSHLGNSQLIRIHPSAIGDIQSDTLPIPSDIVPTDPNTLMKEEDDDDDMGVNLSKNTQGLVVKTKGTFVEVLETFYNIAPIVDAVSADVDGSGQPQIVTCSGGGNKGTLNFVRTGADFDERAVIKDISDVTVVWPIRTNFKSLFDSHILACTPHGSHLFRLDSERSVFHMDASADGLEISAPTLALCNIARRVTKTAGGRTTSSYVDSSLVVQVTSQRINLLEFDEALGLFHLAGEPWTPQGYDDTWRGREIVAASVNASQIVIGLSGGRLALLNLNEAKEFHLVKFKDFSSSASQAKEVCAVSCVPFDPSKHFSLYIVVSFWGDRSITILSLEKAEDYMTVVCTSTPLSSLPGSLLMYNFGSGRKSKDEDYRPHILAGLMDGTVVGFSFKRRGLVDKRIYTLGSLPVSLSGCVVDGRRSVFATGSRSSIFYWDKQRLHQSHILLKGISIGVSLNTPSFPSCLILASSTTLSLGQVRGVDKTQLRSIDLGLENPTRIAYHDASNQFGVACLHVTPKRIGEPEISRSTFSLFDGNTLKRSASFSCEHDEEITAVRPIGLSLPEMLGANSPAFCVGIVRHQPGEHDPTAGRINILIGDNNEGASTRTARRVTSITSVRVDGCVYSLDVSGDMIVAGINSSVATYKIRTSGQTTQLEPITRWNHNYFVTNIICRDDVIAVGDAINSISMLQIDGDNLKIIARDYEPLWPTALEMTATKDIVGATTDCDLFTFSPEARNTSTILEQKGSYQLGEVVTRFLRGAITYQDPQDGGMFQPEHLFFTTSGRIGLISHVDDAIALKLTALQRNMENIIKGPGTVSHSSWHAPLKSRRKDDPEAAFGFLDGDFLEQFTTHPDKARLLRGESDAEKVAFDSIELENILEKLQSLH